MAVRHRCLNNQFVPAGTDVLQRHDRLDHGGLMSLGGHLNFHGGSDVHDEAAAAPDDQRAGRLRFDLPYRPREYAQRVTGLERSSCRRLKRHEILDQIKAHRRRSRGIKANDDGTELQVVM